MKRSSRVLCLLLGVLMLLGALAACGGNETPTTTQQVAQGGQTTATPTKPATSSNEITAQPGTTVPPVVEPGTTVPPVVEPGTTVPPVTEPGTTVPPVVEPGTTKVPEATTIFAPHGVDENGYPRDSLDRDAIDYSDPVEGAHKFRILLCQAWSQWTFPAEEGSQNNPMQTTAFYRNIEIEENFGVYFQVNRVPGHGGHESEWMVAAAAAVGEGCEMICGYSLWMAKHAQQDYLVNLYNYEYPELQMPWYPTQLEEWSQYNCMFFLTGTATTRGTAEGIVTFADLNKISDMGLEDPMGVVVRGDWTMDKLYEYTSAFHDLAISTQGTASPEYGICIDHRGRMYSYYYALGNRFTTLNSRGRQELACISPSAMQRASECVEEVFRVWDTAEAYLAPSDDTSAMREHRTGFMVCGMLNITWIEDDQPYAALPMPKRDIYQEDYLTITTYAFEVFGIPKTSDDCEMSTVILEAVFSSDFRDMAPLFYEKNLKGRYTNSSVGSVIYDIIRQTRVIDFGFISKPANTGPENAWGACFSGETLANNFVVQMTNDVNYQNKLYKALNDLLAVYKSHGSV